jgi:hypothetical protein
MGTPLPLGDLIEKVEEFREADGGGFGAVNDCVASRAEGYDAEGHGDTVMATGVGRDRGSQAADKAYVVALEPS